MSEKILLVDDDIDTLRLVGMMLQRQGYQVQAANSGKQALTIIQDELPDLILLDVMMPEMDGYEVARRLRADERTAGIPIIMFTAKSQIDDKVKGFEAGADDYLTKPTQPRELFAHLKAVLTRSSKSQKPIESPLPKYKGYQTGIIAAKGGLGVSTLTINLGIKVYQELGNHIIVADFRPGQGSIGLELGYMKAEGLNRLLQKPAQEISAKDVETELLVHASGVKLLLSSHNPQDAGNAYLTEHFLRINQHLIGLSRYIFLDMGSGLTPTNQKILTLCDHVVIVVEPVPHTLKQTRLLLDNLEQIGIGEVRTTIALINRIRSGVQLSWSQAQEQLGQQISAIFTPAPELAYQASNHSVPMIIQQPESMTSQQFQQLAKRITQFSTS